MTSDATYKELLCSFNLEASAPLGSSVGESRSLKVQALSDEHEAEALSFLAERPLHTVFMSGLIRDNGMTSAMNRGTFYGCRDANGQLEGVALIGHATLVESHSEAALAAFARVAQDCPHAHMILGEEEKVEVFWNYFSQDGQTPRRVCRELLLEQRWPAESYEEVTALRQAALEDLPILLPVYAEMVMEESGVNPLEKDREGFTRRWARRIEQGRVWVWIKGDRLVYNTDILFDTPEVIYLEGVYVHPQERNKGNGLRCLSQLSRTLLERTGSLCLFVNEQNRAAQAFYRAAGFEMRSYYDTLFLHLKN